ncbi:MAG: VWA domain-containing protein [Rhodospirillales bacterium]|nr:VWA domain-containing protein [Rhodospirillales bacterium]
MTAGGATFVANVMHFARLLRRAGLRLGPADTLAAITALSRIDLASRTETRAALQATLLRRHEDADLFAQAFAMFWRDPEAARAAAAMALMEGGKEKPPERAPPGSRRLAEALAKPREKREPPPDRPPEIEAVMTVSERERLQQMDFEAMSAAEIDNAKSAIRKLRLPLDLRRTRRRRPDPSGPHTDLRATIRASLRQGGEILSIESSRRTTRPPPLVVLCDISGSMSRYAQILLHFLHAVANDRERVSVFLFGTRLSNITRQLRHRDPEMAFQMVAHAVPDWSGGTRIGEALAMFNRNWARRVLGQGAVVLLVTDGLDRDGAHGLAENMERLHKSCRRLIWLNPLLRWDGFEPKSQGIRAMLPHVDEFRTVHNLASLGALVETLSRPGNPRAMDAWRIAA